MALGTRSASLGSGTLSQFKGSFFDAAPVLRAMDRAERKVLSRFGAFVRQKARTSIRYAPSVNVSTGQIQRGRKKKDVEYRDAVSKPGKPPFAHKTSSKVKVNKKGVAKRTGYSLLRDFIFFAYEPLSHSVIIGPALLNGSVNKGPETVPAVLEYGGQAVITKRGKYGASTRKFRISARPYMRPAFDAEIGKLAPMFKDSLR